MSIYRQDQSGHTQKLPPVGHVRQRLPELPLLPPTGPVDDEAEKRWRRELQEVESELMDDEDEW